MLRHTTGYETARYINERMPLAMSLCFVVAIVFPLSAYIAGRVITPLSTRDYRELLVFFIAGGAFLMAVFSIFLSVLQAQLAFAQIAQAEELASRKDETLIAALETLAKELKRRPAPTPVVNFSLFGPRSRESERA
jgi:hypothetical protein